MKHHQGVSGIIHLRWKYVLSDIQNKNKTKPVFCQYYRLTGKHLYKQMLMEFKWKHTQ